MKRLAESIFDKDITEKDIEITPEIAINGFIKPELKKIFGTSPDWNIRVGKGDYFSNSYIVKLEYMCEIELKGSSEKLTCILEYSLSFLDGELSIIMPCVKFDDIKYQNKSGGDLVVFISVHSPDPVFKRLIKQFKINEPNFKINAKELIDLIINFAKGFKKYVSSNDYKDLINELSEFSRNKSGTFATGSNSELRKSVRKKLYNNIIGFIK